MKKAKGISLIALVLTIIVMVILTGVVINAITGEGIFNSAINSVERSNIATDKDRIELSIIEVISDQKKLTIDSIVDKLVEKNITTEANVNRDTNQVKTDKGYIFEIDKNDNNNWEVKYIGKGTLAKTELDINITKDINVLTTRLTLTLTAKADSGIAKYTNPEGEEKTYAGKQTTISETYEITANGTYTFTVENKKGKQETKSIEINNILEGTIAISPNKTEETNEDIIVTVVWPSRSEQGVKEIKVGEGNWQTYEEETSQVTVKQNCTVRARVTSEVGEVTSASLTIEKIDKLPPKAFTPTATATSNSITISGSTEDATATSTNASSGIIAYYFRKNGGKWETNTNPLETSYTFKELTKETTYTLEMKAVDKAGNETITTAIEKATEGIAGGDDVIQIVPSKSEPTNQDITVSVTWPEDTEGLTKEISINGGSTWSTYTGAVPITGNCTVKARLRDNTNQTGNVASVTIANIDKVAPTISSITNPSNGNWAKGDVTITIAGTDSGLGIKEIEWYENGAWTTRALTTTNGTGTITYTAERNETIRYRAVDRAGNVSEEATTVVKIDKTAPTVSLSLNGGSGYTMPSSGNATISTVATVTETGGSGISTIQYAWSQSNSTEPSSWTNFTSGATISKTDISAAGTWYLWFKVIDGAGNMATSIKTSNGFIISSNADAANKITLQPSATTWTKGDVTVTVTYGSNLTGAKTLTCTGTSGTDYTVSGTSSVVVKTNSKTVTATAKDKAGNTISASLTISCIDKSAPGAPAITGGSTDWATSRTISVSTVASDVGSGVSYYQYYTTNSSTAPAASTSATGNVGSTANDKSKTFNTDYNAYYVYFRAVDGVGNIGAWSSAQRLYIDVNKPTVSLATAGTATIDQGTSYNVANYFTYSANGNAGVKSVTYTVGGQSISNTSGLAEGTHTIVCTVTKNNNLSQSASKTVVVKSAVPSGSWEFVANGSVWTAPTGVTVVKLSMIGGKGVEATHSVTPQKSYTFNTGWRPSPAGVFLRLICNGTDVFACPEELYSNNFKLEWSAAITNAGAASGALP